MRLGFGHQIGDTLTLANTAAREPMEMAKAVSA
jgi:hypothetical protein